LDPLSRDRSTSISDKSLANLRPWKPGESGNRAGRPRKMVVTEIFEEILQNPDMREAVKGQIVSTITSRGMAGVLLLREMAERTEGKVTQGIELSGTISTMTDEQVDERLTKLLDLDLKQHENSVIDVQPTQDSTHEPQRDTLTTK
jgi:hypothetical protein